ncbi:MAG: hypothetical protein ACLRMJ_12720 [Alistipes finegoldii]
MGNIFDGIGVAPRLSQPLRPEKNWAKTFVVKLDKGQLPSLKEVLTEELSGVIKDIEYLNNNPSGFDTQCKFIEGSALLNYLRLQTEQLVQ